MSWTGLEAGRKDKRYNISDKNLTGIADLEGLYLLG
jgi:hypothetical protein